MFAYGEVLHRMRMADFITFSLNEKHLSVVQCGRCLRVSLLHFLFFSQRVISRVFGAATCPSVVHTKLCCSRVRKNQRQHCTAYFKTGCHGHIYNHCLNIIPEREFLDKVDIEASHSVIYAQQRC